MDRFIRLNPMGLEQENDMLSLISVDGGGVAPWMSLHLAPHPPQPYFEEGLVHISAGVEHTIIEPSLRETKDKISIWPVWATHPQPR